MSVQTEKIQAVQQVGRVKKYPLMVEQDFEEAQEILNTSMRLVKIKASAWDAYNYRDQEGLGFLGTYEVYIERKEDYEDFLIRLKNETTNEIANKVTFDAWKSGYITDESGRKQRLGKWLKKMGISAYLLDFYSRQIREEKKVYITISDRVQHIAGMSFYARMGSWNGYGGTSCQDPRHDASQIEHLLGSLYDNKLYVAMLHYNIDAVHDMTDNLKARTVMRLVHIDDVPCLVATSYYGNVVTKNELHEALKQLRVFDIYDASILEGNTVSIEESANGYYEYSVSDTATISIDDWYEISYTCPICGGNGEISIYTDHFEYYVEVTCPHCGGDGTVYDETLIELEEEIEVDDIEHESILPYNEEYDHYGDYIRIYIDIEAIRKSRKENGLALV